MMLLFGVRFIVYRVFGLNRYSSEHCWKCSRVQICERGPYLLADFDPKRVQIQRGSKSAVTPAQTWTFYGCFTFGFNFAGAGAFPTEAHFGVSLQPYVRFICENNVAEIFFCSEIILSKCQSFDSDFFLYQLI